MDKIALGKLQPVIYERRIAMSYLRMGEIRQHEVPESAGFPEGNTVLLYGAPDEPVFSVLGAKKSDNVWYVVISIWIGDARQEMEAPIKRFDKWLFATFDIEGRQRNIYLN
jgi:hypothetical protein